MKRLGAVAVALWAAAACAQFWEPVDGGFRIDSPRASPFRQIEGILPERSDGDFVFRDSDDARTEVRFRFRGSAPRSTIGVTGGTPWTVHYGSHNVSVYQSVSINFSIPSSDTIECTLPPNAMVTTTPNWGTGRTGLRVSLGRSVWILSSSLCDLRAAIGGIEASCDGATRTQFQLVLANVEHLPSRPNLLSADIAAGAVSEDGGAVVFNTNGQRFEWNGGQWIDAGSTPLSNLVSVARTANGELIALADEGAETYAWRGSENTFTRLGVVARGTLVSLSDGGVLNMNSATASASAFTGSDWAAVPWPAQHIGVSALARPDGRLWATTSQGFGVISGADFTALEGSCSGLLFMLPGAPGCIGSAFVVPQPAPDGGIVWATLGLGDGLPPLHAGHTAGNAVLLVVSNGTLRIDPYRSVGSTCSFNEQCQSGACVDGRCCDRACGISSCEVCSVERGASENGVCTAQPDAVCAPPAQSDAGIDMPPPEKPAGCGCTSAESLLAVVALIALRRRALPPRA